VGRVEIGRRDPGSVHAVLPSDHVISPAKDFRRALLAGADEAEASSALVTFGIRPTFPATGYGWIEVGDRLEDRRGVGVHAVVRFVEKPERDARGSVPRRRTPRLELRDVRLAHRVDPRRPPRARARDRRTDRGRPRPRRRRGGLSGLPSVSIDVAVLEKTRSVRVVTVDFTWSDVGAWSALADVLPRTRRAIAPAAGSGCSGGGRGLHRLGPPRRADRPHRRPDLVVVRAGKATLVCPRERSQEIRKIVARLEKEDPSFL
jgi:mannose-1-phosphate guanylyltransferase